MTRRELPHADVVADPARLASAAKEYGLLVSEHEGSGEPRALACPKCGTEWMLPHPPYAWTWIACPSGCNLPKDRRLIVDLVCRVARWP